MTSSDSVSVNYAPSGDAETSRIQDVAGNDAAGFSGQTAANHTPVPGNRAATGQPSIFGTAQVGKTLAVDTSTVADLDGMTGATFGYQWISDEGTADIYIQGANGSTYQLASADEGKTVKVQVTFSDDGGTTETLTSGATDVVVRAMPVSICGRTRLVREAILEKIQGIDQCSLVPVESLNRVTGTLDLTPWRVVTLKPIDFQHLSSLERMDVSGNFWLDELPVGVFDDLTGLKELDLFATSSGDLELPGGIFDNLASLESLDLSSNHMTELQEGVFDGLSNLKELQLRGNDLAELPEGVFDGLSNLKELQLGSNDLAELPEGVFDGLSSLKKLNLFNNGLSELPAGLFDNLTNLEYLELTSNNLNELPEGAFEGISNLKRLRLADNPGAPFTFTAALEQQGSGVIVKLSGAGPLDMTVTISAQGGTLSVGTVEAASVTVTVQSGTNTSEAITVTPDTGQTQVTVNVDSAAFISNPFPSNSSGLQTATGSALVITALQLEGQSGEPPTNVAAEGAPTIAGTAHVGQTLTADTSGISDTDGLTNVSYSYQWVRNDGSADSDTAGATGSTYDLVDDDQGKTIKVKVSFTDDDGNQESLTSAATGIVGAALLKASFLDAPANHSGTGSFTFELRFSENVKMGFQKMHDHVLTVTGGEVDSASRVQQGSNIRWNIHVQPDGNGDVTVTLPKTTDCNDQGSVCTQSGKMLSGQVSLTIPGPQQQDSGQGEGNQNNAPMGLPTISGTARVGETLTASTSGITDSDGLTNVSYSYQWIRNDGGADSDIAGATNSTYELADADQGKGIKVRVSFTDNRNNQESLTSAATGTVAPRPNRPATGAPTISGTATVGQTLTASTSGIMDADGLDDVSYSYQWVRNDGSADGDISGATGPSYELADADQGKTIKVRVSFTDDRNNDESLTSAATGTVAARPNSAATGAPTISGTAQVGQTLTASTSGIEDADGLDDVSYSYQWIRSDGSTDTDIAGATDSNYDLAQADQGKTIKVRVSFTDDRSNQESLTSAATGTVAARPNTAATGAPTISGTAQVGETLTASTSGISDADGLDNVSYSYQWIRNDGTTDSDISGATGSTYELVDADQGKTIKVKVSFTDDWNNQESLTSEATGTVAARPALTVSFESTPASHDGSAAFTFELRFSEEVKLSYKDLRDHGFQVTGGTVTRAKRLDKPSNVRWEIHVQPSGNSNVIVILPKTTDCDDDGAVCTEDGRKLSNRTELTVNGPS